MRVQGPVSFVPSGWAAQSSAPYRRQESGSCGRRAHQRRSCTAPSVATVGVDSSPGQASDPGSLQRPAGAVAAPAHPATCAHPPSTSARKTRFSRHRRKYRDFAAVVWHRACRTAARRAARAASRVRRARPDVGTTHPAPARRARSAAKRVIPPCGGEVVGWGREVNVQDGDGNRSGLLVRGEGSMA